MRSTLSLLQRSVKLVLFSRQNCSLCDTAKSVVSNVRSNKPSTEYTEIDVMSRGNEGWKDLYEFDTPVLHVQSSNDSITPSTTTGVLKLMHRFSEDQVLDLITQAEKTASI